MAQFKVGQRVKVIDQHPDSMRNWGPRLQQEATISAIPGILCDCHILFDGDAQTWSADFYQLAPLTDPRADAFLESIKKIAREPNNIVKVTA